MTDKIINPGSIGKRPLNAIMGDDKEMLEDLVTAAMNDALRRAEQTASERMSSVTSGLPLPPGFKLPF